MHQKSFRIHCAEVEAGLRNLWESTDQLRSSESLRKCLVPGVWIYGAGGHGRKIRNLLERAEIRVAGFVDRRASDATFRKSLDLPVRSPDAFISEESAGHALVIGLFNFGADLRPVSAWASSLQFSCIVMPEELPDVLGEEAGGYWLTSRHHTIANLPALIESLDILADDKSREVVIELSRYRVSANHAFHPASDLASQYNPPDVPALPDRLVLIDGGAYTGDTIEALVQQGVSIAEWYAFEPDPGNFEKLSHAAHRFDGRTVLFPCGLGNTSKTVNFSFGFGAGSHATDNASTTVKIVALDEILFGISPTYIKLDVEGFERQALDGMKRTLAELRPRLAISIYHKPEDLWELPQKVRALMPGSKLYVRQHGFMGFDTVLYAV